MTLRSLVLAGAALLLVAAKAPEERIVSYRVTPVRTAEGKAALRVDMRFRGDSDGETLLRLPSEWAGSAELWRHATGLRIRGARSLAGWYDKPMIRHRPGGRIRVRYTLVSPWDGPPGFGYEKARPLIGADGFFFHGEGAFAAPDGRQAAPARFRWGTLPKGWTVASDLDHLNGEPTSVANLIDSVAIGGPKLRVVTRDLGGAPLRLAMLGRWNFPPEALAELAAAVIEAENDYWGDPASPFLIAMAPLGELPSGLSYTGTGRTDAFSIASTSAFGLDNVIRFLAHEYMHSWVPGELGALPPRDEGRDYWFSEGFNDYLAAKVLLRSGLWTLDDWAADKNETLLRYGTSPARAADAATVAARFWSDPAVQQVSYDRGHLLAALLDSRLGGGLDPVMRAQRRAAAGSTELASDLLLQVLRETTQLDFGAEIERHARRGEPIVLAPDLLAPCVRIVGDRRREFHRGYDAEATRIAGGVIAGVVPDGPAFAAGMRDGMRLVSREAGRIGDSTVEIAYRVADESGAERVLRYLPQGRSEFEVQRLELAAGSAEEKADCVRRLGGGE